METTTQEWLRVPEVAKDLRIPRSRAYELIQRGDLPAVRIGERSIRVHRGELERFLLETRRVVASKEPPLDRQPVNDARGSTT
jgi:excisionase family DNA binding protein